MPRMVHGADAARDACVSESGALEGWFGNDCRTRLGPEGGAQMIVADSNLIASCVLMSEATDAALALRARDSDWQVPRLWRYEVLNVFATMIKAGRLSRTVADRLYRQLVAVLRAGERDSDPSRVLALVEEFGISGYDAQFVALAQELGVPLFTQDREILKKFPSVAQRFYRRGAST